MQNVGYATVSAADVDSFLSISLDILSSDLPIGDLVK